MTKHPATSRLTTALFAALLALPTYAQTNGSWITAGGGTYSNAENWLDSTVAGSGGSANFNTVNIPAGASTVTLDVATSLNALTFGDTDTATAGTWTLTGAGGLTLTDTTPTITNHVNTTISTIIGGSQGLTKSGAGTLLLSAINTYSGVTNVTAGTLQLGNGSGAGTSTYSFANGTTFNIGNSATVFSGNALSVASGATVNFASGNAAAGYSGLITGDATSKIVFVSGTQVNLDRRLNEQQFATFLGTVEVASGGTLRFSASSALNNGGMNTTFNVLAGGTITARNSGTVRLGELTGAGSIFGSGGANGTTIYVVGEKNTNSTFSGSISDSAASRFAAFTKAGTGTLTVSGTSGYTGTTNINGGTLLLTGSKTGAGAITVATTGTLGGTGSLTGATTVNGTLRTNTAPTDATSRLTFTTSLTLAASSDTIFDIDGANFTGVTVSTAESLTFGGDLTFNFINGVTVGTYDLFAFTDSNTGSFVSVTLASLGGLNIADNVWSGTYGGFNYSFSQLTGDLVVSAIPEPSAFAAIAGAFGLGCAALGRRRRAA